MTTDDSDALLPGPPAAPAAPVISDRSPYDPISSPDSFQTVDLGATYSPDDRPFETFYLPLLARAVTYDRAVGYWSAAELQYAAQGTAHFLANGGKMRLIVGAQLAQRDVEAVIEGKPLDDVVAERLLADPELAGARIVQNEYLSVLAWMVATDRLEIRVGVPRGESGELLTHEQSGRYFHTKYGIFADGYGNRVAFNGSNNSSVTAWAKNHETFDAYPSWNTPIWDYLGVHKVLDFEKHWTDNADAGWAVIDLPTAVRMHLIEHAPDTPPLPPGVFLPPSEVPHSAADDTDEFDVEAAWDELVALRDAPRESSWTGVGSAWAQPLPHQAELINRVVSTYPRGYLLADEVGLGKTVEAGMVLRELFTSGRAKKALLLVPASVMKQWQEELHEKMNLDVPRFDKGIFVDRHDQPIPVTPNANPWSAFPVVLASSHLARRRDRRRQVLDAGPWDVVLVDEAHHARRRGSKPTDTPNSLLALLQEMRDREMWRALYLATATPMQMNPHEAWDLISLLGLKGRWGVSADDFIRYFKLLAIDPMHRHWDLLCAMLEDYFSDPQAERDTDLEQQIDDALGWTGAYAVTALAGNSPSADLKAKFPNETSEWMDKWLRRHTPMRDRVFRNTRTTMREYQAEGIIPDDVVIPYRHVKDEFIPLEPNERRLYERIEEYIRRHYNAYMAEAGNQALGFIMTVYRRRLTSSFEAIKRSLRRRLSVLENGTHLAELLTDDDNVDVEGSLFEPEAFDTRADRLRDEITELKSFLQDLDSITGEDSKATKLVADMTEALNTYSSVVIFTQYSDTMDYVRERLITAGYRRLGCYSGRGGEVYDTDSATWAEVTKSEIKTKFRSGELEVLIGTDSMSEGLNLQTSGRLINYDMPWNLMRVEQRIGRIDRIGASYKDIRISNYFYADTVEEQVYKGIAEDYGDFTDIVGDAAPVLANIEKAIERLALFGHTTPTDIESEVGDIRQQVEDIKNEPVGNGDLGEPAGERRIKEPPKLVGATSPEDLEHLLTTNGLTRAAFKLDEERPNVYRLKPPAETVSRLSFNELDGVRDIEEYFNQSPVEALPVTFDRATWDESDDASLVFLTFGTPELAALLPSPGADANPRGARQKL
ncbi:DEAD/DEAH box helicase family protein [Demequina sp. TTPB684]|uniref:DEAD/DEAH box helicase n=1 Tax=unclassified Demequina TaxID=2620311 RepID=UPI001CF52973|nr:MULTISPECIES: SNF2-related protein [unclassified Demequina]MCB2413083.1 DEAD/DEAH box helicase family protein [Demequina sp. TTPB684]UPU88109.1 SNF2-related protein [Demequina sp. TMPB413]